MGQFYLSCLQESGIGSCPESIYGGSANCCYTVNCKFRLSPSYPATTITAIYPDAGNTCQFDVLLINGIPFANPLAAPIVINQGDEIDLQLQVCVCDATIPFQISFGLAIDTTGSLGPATDYLYYCAETINPQSLAYDPLPVSLVTWTLNPCIGTSGCTDLIGSIPFTNYSSFDVPVIFIDAGPNLPVGTVYYVNGVAQPGNIMVVPANSTAQLGLGFCWPNSTPVNFDIDVVVCDVYNRRVTIDVIPAICLGCGVGCTDIEFNTEGAYLPNLSLGCQFELPSVYDQAAVGEKKTVFWKYTYNNGFTGANFDLYFNPILWTNIQSVLPIDPYTLSLPTSGWYIKIQGFMVGGGLYNMYQLTSPTNEPSQKNWEVQIEIPTPNELYILFTFYMTMDIDDKITNTQLDNGKRFMVSQVAETISNQNLGSLSCVYNNIRFLGKELFFVDNNVSDPNSVIDRPFRCFLYRTIPMTARWYNRSIYGNPSEFQNPTFTYYRNGQFWPASFATFNETEVTFEIDLPGGAVPSTMVAYLFENTDPAVSTNNLVDFTVNYDLSWGPITTNALPATINNNIKSPSQGPTNIGGDRWQIKFMVGTALNSATGYGLAVIVYDDANSMVNTFTAGAYIPVDPNPTEDALCCPLDIDTEWSDYINTYTNVYPFVTVYKQRVQNKIVVEGGLFAADCLTNLGFTGDWIRLITDVTLRVYDRRLINLPSTSNDLWVNFMYYQYQSLYNSTYPGNFNNLNTDFVAEDNGLGQLILKWNGRIRWESNVQFPTSNVYTSFQDSEYNWSTAGGSALTYINQFNINYDWTNGPLFPIDATGRIFFDYIITFDLSTILNLPNNQPFYVKKVIRQRLDPYREEPIVPINGSIPDLFDPLVLEGWNGATYVPLNGPICPGDYEHVKATLIAQDVNQAGYVIGFFNRSPYGILQLKEDDETAISPNGFTQLDSQYIYDTTTGVQVGTWEFKIDVNSLPQGTYEICALYLPLIPI